MNDEIKTVSTSEWVSTGHPDKTCDAIASYLLDRYLEKDRDVRAGIEVQLKDTFCRVAGEITSSWSQGKERDKEVSREVRDVCDVCCEPKARLVGNDHFLCDRCASAYECRWFDKMMACCRHPRHYEEMARRNVFFEPTCNGRKDGCGYEKCDEQHPAWDGGDEEGVY